MAVRDERGEGLTVADLIVRDQPRHALIFRQETGDTNALGEVPYLGCG